jgi:hypothetical protein
MKKNKKILGLFFPLLLGFLLMTFLTACKSEEKSEEKMEEETVPMVISKDMLTPILGEGEGSVSGLLDVEQSRDELKISYYYYIEDMAYFDEEIERDLAPKIQEMYKNIPELDRVAFTVYIPTLGETPYKPYVSFVVNRELVEKTDWTNLVELEFFNVVMDVKYYEE